MSDDKQFNSIEEIEDNKTKWNLTSDLKLLRLLKNTSNECMDRMQKNLNEFDDLNFKADTAANKVNNLITDILILTNTKFIENRVYDEDLKDITSKNETTAKTVDAHQPPLDDEQKLIKKLENSVNKAMEKLSVAYDMSQTDLIENNSYNLLHTLYTKKNRFSQKSLPYIIGSDEFLKDTFVGLKDEIDFPVLEPQQQQQTIDDKEDPEQDVSNHIDTNVEVFSEPQQNNITPVNNIIQPEYSAYKLPENLPNIENNINNLFDSGKAQMPVYSDSSEDEDIFTRPTITRTNTINGDNTLLNNDDDDEQESTLFKSTISDEKDDLFKSEQEDKIDFQSSVANNQPKISNKFLDEDEDEDFDSIFTAKSSQKVNSKTNSNVFFSSDDDNDDDDFFTQISKTSIKNKNKVSSSPPLPKASTVDNLKNGPINEPVLEASKPQSSASKPKTNDIKSKEELSNVINELNSVLQKKMSPEVEQKQVFTENVSVVNDNESVPQNKTIVEKVENINDDLNSMLKHKTRLNSKRIRRRPSKFQKSIVQAEPEPEEHSESDDLFGGVETFQHKDPIQAEPEEHSDLDDIFTSSVSVSKVPEPEKQSAEPEIVQKNPEIRPKQNDLRSKSIFDSSDDSDEDIFTKKKSSNIVSSKPNIQKTVPLFPSSDESDNEAKLSINRKPENVVPTAQKRQTVSSRIDNEISKTKKQVKSIFDDNDDSDDDLFKF